jgi:endonuclease III
MVSSIIEVFGRDPFLILIGCLLSLRSKDSTTLPVCIQLFQKARTPEALLAISIKDLTKIFYPIGFYRKKAVIVHKVCRKLLDEFEGKVPKTREELLSLPGVGRKTANLVLGRGFGIPAICVDTHVHRISNRLGLVATKTPEQTEKALERILPKKYWIVWNELLVTWGQTVCVPISPYCSQCSIFKLCKRVGIKKSR